MNTARITGESSRLQRSWLNIMSHDNSIHVRLSVRPYKRLLRPSYTYCVILGFFAGPLSSKSAYLAFHRLHFLCRLSKSSRTLVKIRNGSKLLAFAGPSTSMPSSSASASSSPASSSFNASTSPNHSLLYPSTSPLTVHVTPNAPNTRKSRLLSSRAIPSCARDAPFSACAASRAERRCVSRRRASASSARRRAVSVAEAEMEARVLKSSESKSAMRRSAFVWIVSERRGIWMIWTLLSLSLWS
ncbi:hypothetical protein R3P38DRAFT_3429117 [Favolaschia claudopus]|uniref:Uncharacterized protein n=1 Tax=Favolaschia claudopus TaxID=2862362 RepID=A0AAV9ZVU5_9AGAR